MREMLWVTSLMSALASVPAVVPAPARLPGTQPAQVSPDILREQHAEVERYFLDRIEDARKRRSRRWQRDYGSLSSYRASMSTNRERFRRMIGLIDPLPSPVPVQRREIARTATSAAEHVSWMSAGGVPVEGLLLLPDSPIRQPAVIIVTDAGDTPAGWASEIDSPARRLAQAGAAVVVFSPIPREKIAGYPLDRRHRLYRQATQVGRHLIGSEVAMTLAAVEWVSQLPEVDPERIAVWGEGQGGQTAFYAAALSERIRAAAVGQYFGERERAYGEPVDRVLTGQLLEFGDADIASLIAPRRLILYGTPERETVDATRAEFLRAYSHYRRFGHPELATLAVDSSRSTALIAVAHAIDRTLAASAAGVASGYLPSAEEWQEETRTRFAALERAYQREAARSAEERDRRWTRDYSSVEAYRESLRPMLAAYRELLGEFPRPRDPLSPRTTKVYESDHVLGYQVLLAVYPELHVYGILLLPRAAFEGDRLSRTRRPAVIVQHGFHGRPEFATGIVESDQDETYQKFGLRLAERGYVVFAPYVVVPDSEGVNALARKAVLTGRTRVGLDLVKMGRVLDFLGSLPCVDRRRIGFYGLSYGGYTAIWTAPGESRYAAVVVAGHFNDWVAKTTNLEKSTSYMFHPDEDMYNFGVLNLFNHSDLAAMVCPRPFFVEHGQRDPVTPPEWALPEFERARQHYTRLGIADRIEIDAFPGPHRIWGEASFRFLDRWLKHSPQVVTTSP